MKRYPARVCAFSRSDLVRSIIAIALERPQNRRPRMDTKIDAKRKTDEPQMNADRRRYQKHYGRHKTTTASAGSYRHILSVIPDLRARCDLLRTLFIRVNLRSSAVQVFLRFMSIRGCYFACLSARRLNDSLSSRSARLTPSAIEISPAIIAV